MSDVEKQITDTLARQVEIEVAKRQEAEGKLKEAQDRIEELEAEKKELEDKLERASEVLGMVWREAKDAWTKI